MSDFLQVKHFSVPLGVVQQTVDFLRQVGGHGHEGLVFWCGKLDRDEAVVQRIVIPDQRPIRVENGICVTVGPQALHDLNVLLYENQMRLIAQVHSHAENAYHSETDDRFSIVTTLGALSIVVPFFAASGIVLSECAIYQLCNSGWHEFSTVQKTALLKVI
jgi:hypothetical protein